MVSPTSYVAIVVIVGAVVYGFVRKTLQSFTLGIAVLVVFILQVYSRDGIVPELQLSWTGGVLSPLYSWVTYEFLHASLSHLLFNLLALLLIAPSFEERIGSVRFVVLFFVGGIVGAAGFLALNIGSSLALVGASASISSVFGAYGRLFPRDKVQLFIPIPGVPSLPVIDVVIAFLVIETALSILGPYSGLGSIAWQAHVIAMAFGFAAAPVVKLLPTGPARLAHLPRIAGWAALATTSELRAILEEAERADVPEVRQAWIEKLVRAARCPQCGGPLRRRLGSVVSSCGWRLRIR
jgi:membrane associated rhomboid family serine protease